MFGYPGRDGRSLASWRTLRWVSRSALLESGGSARLQRVLQLHWCSPWAHPRWWPMSPGRAVLGKGGRPRGRSGRPRPRRLSCRVVSRRTRCRTSSRSAWRGPSPESPTSSSRRAAGRASVGRWCRWGRREDQTSRVPGPFPARQDDALACRPRCERHSHLPRFASRSWTGWSRRRWVVSAWRLRSHRWTGRLRLLFRRVMSQGPRGRAMPRGRRLHRARTGRLGRARLTQLGRRMQPRRLRQRQPRQTLRRSRPTLVAAWRVRVCPGGNPARSRRGPGARGLPRTCRCR